MRATTLSSASFGTGLGVTRRDAVDCDPFFGELEHGALGEANHAGLGGRVISLAKVAHLADHRADVDDAAVALLEHVRHHFKGDVENAVQVDVDDRVPVGVPIRAKRNGSPDAPTAAGD